jgi:uncharacterized spore protein YtfJ
MSDNRRRVNQVKLDELMTQAQDAITVKKVFGEPYATEGVTVIPAASVAGGVGGGGGSDERGQSGQGGGYGVAARPAGVYLIKDGTVVWRPAVDVNRLFAVLGAVAVAFLVTRAWAQRARAKAARAG